MIHRPDKHKVSDGTRKEADYLRELLIHVNREIVISATKNHDLGQNEIIQCAAAQAYLDLLCQSLTGIGIALGRKPEFDLLAKAVVGKINSLLRIITQTHPNESN